MKTFFCSQDLWDIIEEGFTIPEDTSTLTAAQKKELKENKQKDSRALFVLQQAIDDTIFPRIIGATSAKQAWNTIQEEFEGSDGVCNVKLHSLRREFELLRMKESETIKDYYYRIKEIVSQMRAYGENILDKKNFEKILISIPQKYDAIATAIEQTKYLATLSVTQLMGSLEAYEQRLKRHEEDSVENVFQSKLKLLSQKECEGNKSRGEISRNKENSRSFSIIHQAKYPPCGICKKASHLEKDCWHHGKP
ncbi:uncharacterized protein LOC106780494 [Vigna radiata var. radiata]|uniref:Uncharacterized protein LOC106780494 n=1 Tax=Vigna radiata var. radiata TaxID=3916 RepID=A0A1S3W0T4_VIGRR|nr:uncharacterized protein LOC106780494 [Vigna radiata var. radiata]